MNPDNPTYQIRVGMPTPVAPPDHPFEPSGLDFCDHVVLVLDTHTVYCGLSRRYHEARSHPTGVIQPLEPRDPA